MTDFVVAHESEIAPGKMLAVKAGTKNIVVFCSLDGNFSALEDRCSHAEVRLSGGKFENGQVTCPAHGARFDVISGKALCMPAIAGVKKYTVKVQDGQIVISIP